MADYKKKLFNTSSSNAEAHMRIDEKPAVGKAGYPRIPAGTHSLPDPINIRMPTLKDGVHPSDTVPVRLPKPPRYPRAHGHPKNHHYGPTLRPDKPERM